MAVALYLRHIELVSAAKAVDEAGLLDRVAHCDPATQAILRQICTFLCTDAADIKALQSFGDTNDFPPVSIARKVKYALPRMKQTAPSAKLLYRWLCAAVKFMDAVVPIGEYRPQKLSHPEPSPRTAANANAWIFENWNDIFGENQKPEELPRYLLQNGVLQPKPYRHLRASTPYMIWTEAGSPIRQHAHAESDVHGQGKSSRIAQHESAVRMMHGATRATCSTANQVRQPQRALSSDKPPTQQPLAAGNKARGEGKAEFPPRRVPRTAPSQGTASFGTQKTQSRKRGPSSPPRNARPPLHSPRGAVAHALVSAGALTQAVPSRAPLAPPCAPPRPARVAPVNARSRAVPSCAPAVPEGAPPPAAHVVSVGAHTRAVSSRAPAVPKPAHRLPRAVHVVPGCARTRAGPSHAPAASKPPALRTTPPPPRATLDVPAPAVSQCDTTTHTQAAHSTTPTPRKCLLARRYSAPNLHAVDSSHPIFDTLWHDQTPSPPASRSPSPSPRMNGAEWRSVRTPSGTKSPSARQDDVRVPDGTSRAPRNHTAQIAKLTEQAKQFEIEMNAEEQKLHADRTLSAVEKELAAETVHSLLRRQQMIQREIKRLEMENS